MTCETLAGAVAATAARFPDRTALVFGVTRESHADLARATLATAQGLLRIGLRPCDRMLCSLSNRPELVHVIAGGWTAGVVPVLADFGCTAPELARIVELTGARALVYEPPDAAPDPFDAVRHLRGLGLDPIVLTAGDIEPPGGAVALASLADVVAPETPVGPSPDDPAMIFISSGTTGRPKAAVAYHGNLSRRWSRLGSWLGFGPDDVHLAHLPLSHGFGLMMAVAGLLTGGRLVMVRDATSGEILRSIVSERVTAFHGAPAHFKLLLARLDPEQHDVRSLRVSVGTAAPFAPPLVREIMARLDVKLMMMYGSTEGVGVATTDVEDILLGSVGRPAAGSVEILGAGGRSVPRGEVGEVAFARSVYPVRYCGDTQTGPPGDPGWYHSGDLGRIDEAGRLYVLGRIKHQIDRGGLKVDPVEVEAALQRLPEVADAAVVGQPNPVLGETVCACIVPAAGAAPSLGSLRDALARELTPFKLPEELLLFEQIPRTSMGKVDLNRLRSEIAAQHLVVR